MKQYLFRLDRIAGELNAWLLAIAIGLGMLDLLVPLAVGVVPGEVHAGSATDPGCGQQRQSGARRRPVSLAANP